MVETHVKAKVNLLAVNKPGKLHDAITDFNHFAT